MNFDRSLRLLAALAIAGAVATTAQVATQLPAAADLAMTIPTVGQQDGAWGAAPLGTSATDTIASAGCAITAVSMMLRYYGIATDPGAFNAWLTGNGGYAFDDELIWDAVTQYSGGRVVFTGWTGPDLGLIRSQLDLAHPVVAEVSLNGNQHFVLIVGYTDSNGLLINDPWFDDTVNFSDRYGDPASGIVSIRTFAPGELPPPPAEWLATRKDDLYQRR